MKVEKLLYGAAYYPEYLPYDRTEEDMEMMERAGMNVIRIAESTWATLEPQDGVFDFSHVDRAIAAAGRHGISVIVGTPTYAIPPWLAKKHPDILAVTADGPQKYGHRQNMDITHPAYLSHAERVIRALISHVCKSPQVIGYQLDNETKHYGTAGERVQKRFVQHLREKYPDIEEFNREFGLDYWSNRVNRWEDFPDVTGAVNESLAAEFQGFQRSLVTEFLEWQAAIVREYARDDQFVTHNFDFDWKSYSYGYQPEVDQFDAARCMTVAGADIYHPSEDLLTGAEITVCGNIARALKQSCYLVLETQAQGNIEWLPYPGQLRLQAYSHVANGANSVLYWPWHSIHNAVESYWKGVLSHDSSENETYREACRVGAEWRRCGDHIKNLRKENRVGVLLDNRSLAGMAHFPLETAGSRSYNDVLRWICDALYRINVEYDMVSSEERDFSRYDFIIAPALYSASDELLGALSSYVRLGGHLIATFRTGFCDERLKIYHDAQPHGLRECLGIRYDQFAYPRGAMVTPADDLPRGYSSALKGAGPARAREWMDLVTCDGASAIATYRHPAWGGYAAVTENKFGSGSSLYLAAMFDDGLLEAILCAFLQKFGCVVPRARFPIIIKRGKNDFDREVTYYFNYSGTAQTATHEGGTGVSLLGGSRVAGGESFLLAPWGVRIIEEA